MIAKAESINLFEKVSVPKAVFSLTLPTIISFLITLVYSLADTFFVGQTNDPNQVAAVALSFPAVMALNAIMNLFGVGGSSTISRALGEKNYIKVKNASSFCFYAAIAVSLIYSTVFLIFRRPLLNILGTSDLTYHHTSNYITWVLIFGSVPSVLNVLLGHLVRAEGDAKRASIGITMGGILNIILDPIFILPFGLGLEITGAAIATFLSNVIATLYFLVVLYKVRKKTVISLNPKYFTLNKKISIPIISIGLPAALQTCLGMVSNTVLNNLTASYSESAVAAVGIVKKIDMLPNKVTMGFAQGVLPLIGYNYAAKNIERLKKSYRFTLSIAVLFALACVCVFELFTLKIIRIFIKDSETVIYGVKFLRIMCLATPLMAINFITTTMFQASGQSRHALTMSLFRKGIVDVPLMLLLNRLFPLYGVVWVQPIVDTAAIFLAFYLYKGFLDKMKTQ